MRKEPAILLANAVIWGVVMIGCSLKLKGMEGAFQEIQAILSGGAVGSLFILMVSVVTTAAARKKASLTDTTVGS